MLRVVLPFCRKDVKAMEELVQWALELNPEGVNHNCLLSYEDGTNPDNIVSLARKYFKGDLLENCYPPPPVPGWPAACNWAWQSAARFVDDRKINEPWFWLESDAIPLKPGWVDDIYEGWEKGGKPFAGHIVDRMDHMNGVGVYPPDVRRRCTEAMLTRMAAWDVVLKQTITGYCTNLNHLIQHIWNIRESDGAITNADGHPVTFPDWKSVERWMDFNACILHRTKDGTLIQRLREKREAERIRLEEEHKKTIAVETNVPNFTAAANAVTIERKVQDIPPVEVMIVTYHKDLPWFELCMKCIRKHLRGFHGVTVCVPNRDRKLFRPLMIEHGFNMYCYDEVEGKGMLQHFGIMAMADQIVPKNVKYVAHIDSDTMFRKETRPEDYFMDGKPVYMIRSYKSLIGANGVISDCHQWKPVTEQLLGRPVEMYTMCAFPFIFPIQFYKSYQDRIEKVHGKPMMQFFLEGRNAFPQDRVDFQAMGEHALENFKDRFHWINVETEPPLKDRHKPFWSHAGLRPDTRAEIESFIQ
jgi:hypothetical protein